MKKVYAIIADRNSLDVALIMVCEDSDDAKDLVDMWGEDYEILEIPFIEKSKEYETFNYPLYRRSTDVEPMPMIKQLENCYPTCATSTSMELEKNVISKA